MDRMFPIGFDSHLSFYLVLYVLTLVVHVFLMAYVLAGSLWLSWVTLFPGDGVIPRTTQPLANVLRDWMPFALSGAITAGVAPLLFVQILYPKQFYTSNLLLGWRWMVVIPVLVTAFYLLYVVKSKAVARWPLMMRLGLSIGIAVCFLFVAFCWTVNHLLGLNSAAWPEAYRSGEAVSSRTALLFRLATWVAGTFPAMSILASWQLRGMRSPGLEEEGSSKALSCDLLLSAEHRRLGVFSIAGLCMAFVCAIGYWTTLAEPVRAQLLGKAGLPWLLISISGIVVQIVVWSQQLRRGCHCTYRLIATTAALLITLLGVASLREIIRISQADLAQVIASTSSAANVGGFTLFLVFAALNTGLMAWCIQMVRSRSDRSM